MKDVLKPLAVATLLGGTTLACSEARPSPSQVRSPDEGRNEYIVRARQQAAEVGHLHNELQRAVLRALLDEKGQSGRMNSARLERVATQACRDFWVQNSMAEWVHTCNAIRDQLQGQAGLTPGPGLVGPLSTPSSAYSTLILGFNEAVQTSSSTAQFTGKTDSLVSAAQATLADTVEVLHVVLLAGMADSSAVYWEEQIEEWAEIPPTCEDYPEHPLCEVPPESPMRVEGFWGEFFDVVGADVAAGAGAVVYNLLSPPTAAAGISATGAAGSATAIVYKIAAWLIPE